MTLTSGIREHMEVIGADGVHIGTVDKVEGKRLKLTKSDSGSGSHQGHHHYLPIGLVADVEGSRVRLSTTGANAFMFQTEEDEGSTNLISDRSANSKKSGNTGSSGASSSWVIPAVGVAAVAAAAGAALFAKNSSNSETKKGSSKSGTKKFELQLQTDENIRLISSTKVEGTPVVGRNGERLGQIQSFMVDKYTGRVAYAVLSFGGTFGFGESLLPLPWSLLDYDVAKDGYVLGLTPEQLKDAPRFKASEQPEFDASYRRDLHRFHSGR
jgi:hypothetical protein